MSARGGGGGGGDRLLRGSSLSEAEKAVLLSRSPGVTRRSMPMAKEVQERAGKGRKSGSDCRLRHKAPDMPGARISKQTQEG